MNELELEKTKRCRYCRTEIPADAKVCPQCRRKQKKGAGKWIVLAVAAVLVLAGIAGKSKKTPDAPSRQETQTEQTSYESKQEEKETVQQANEAPTQTAEDGTAYHVGDIVQDGNLKMVYAASGIYKTDNEFLQPQEGNEYIFLKFVVENTSEKSDCSISTFSFHCFADGYAAEAYYGGEDDLSATLSAGRTASGSVYFEVPADAENIEIEYETNVLTGKKLIFAFEGEQDSGYTPATNVQASEDAHYVGETVTGGDLRISYLACQEYVSDNMFIQPKDGYRFVSCTFEFENIGSSDEYVSTLDFDCFADGVACDASYGPEDSLSATLSAGRKTKGTVTFEIPKDAQIVEVEYLSNYWTSNRVVFAVEP